MCAVAKAPLVVGLARQVVRWAHAEDWDGSNQVPRAIVAADSEPGQLLHLLVPLLPKRHVGRHLVRLSGLEVCNISEVLPSRIIHRQCGPLHHLCSYSRSPHMRGLKVVVGCYSLESAVAQ